MCLCPRQAGRPCPLQGAEWSLPPAGPSLAGLCSARAVGDTGLVPDVVGVGLGQGPCEPPASLGRQTGDQGKDPSPPGAAGLGQRTLGDEPGTAIHQQGCEESRHMLTAAGV